MRLVIHSRPAEKEFKRSAVPGSVVIPTREGIDLYTTDKKYDAHIRLENLPTNKPGRPKFEKEPSILVDVFDTKIDDPAEAHIDSQSFPNTEEGAKEAEDFLRNGIPEEFGGTIFGFDYKVSKGT